jgi:hypothetical protein
MFHFCIYFEKKNMLGYILGDFFTSSSGHPAPCLHEAVITAEQLSCVKSAAQLLFWLAVQLARVGVQCKLRVPSFAWRVHLGRPGNIYFSYFQKFNGSVSL